MNRWALLVMGGDTSDEGLDRPAVGDQLRDAGGSSASQKLGGYPLVLAAVEGTLSPPIGHLLALREQHRGAFVAPTQQSPIIFR